MYHACFLLASPGQNTVHSWNCFIFTSITYQNLIFISDIFPNIIKIRNIEIQTAADVTERFCSKQPAHQSSCTSFSRISPPTHAHHSSSSRWTSSSWPVPRSSCSPPPRSRPSRTTRVHFSTSLLPHLPPRTRPGSALVQNDSNVYGSLDRLPDAKDMEDVVKNTVLIHTSTPQSNTLLDAGRKGEEINGTENDVNKKDKTDHKWKAIAEKHLLKRENAKKSKSPGEERTRHSGSQSEESFSTRRSFLGRNHQAHWSFLGRNNQSSKPSFRCSDLLPRTWFF